MRIHRRAHTDTQAGTYGYTGGHMRIHRRTHADIQAHIYGYTGAHMRIHRRAHAHTQNTEKDIYTQRDQGDLIGLLSFPKIRKVG
jgi:hypothetical protein